MNAAPYDPELPFLAELEERIRARARAAHEARVRPAYTSDPVHGGGARTAPTGAHPRSSGARRGPGARRAINPLAARMTRRTAILVGLLCLLGATAFGARAVFSTRSESPAVVRQGAFVLVAQGHDGADAWTLRLYTRGGELCRALVVVGQAESSRCAPTPGAGTLGVTNLLSARQRYVFGVTGGRVRAVTIHAGATALTLPTQALTAARARAAGTSSATRYFVATLPRPRGRPDPPAIVTGLDAAHRRIGAARVLCPEEAGAEAGDLEAGGREAGPRPCGR